METKQYLDSHNWDEDKAVAAIRADQKSKPPQEKAPGFRAAFSYNHQHRIVTVVLLSCQTDFAGRSELFMGLGQDLVHHVAWEKPASVEEMLEQAFVKEPSLKVADQVARVAAALKETVRVEQIIRVDVEKP